MNDEQLGALIAVVDEGTFEAAARRLQITPSAVSQRIKALERRVGSVVVQRSSPCRPTAAGDVLVRLGRQRAALDADAMDALGHAPGVERLPVAVNADSLATWFPAVFGTAAGWPDVALSLRVEGQDHTGGLLRSGEVVAAVTADPVAVQGCSVTRLGAMRYLPVATPALREAHRKGNGVDWARLPTVQFNDHDDLQAAVLRRHGVEESVTTHQVPSSEAFVQAIAAGLGWGMLPIAQARDGLTAGTLVRLSSTDHVDVQLHWQSWRLRTARLDRLTEAVADAARVLRGR
ncbi:LysR family transcriptional regulator ArgP [Flexivirga sp. ID2601S]|uniref:LysR family transcriptional regulator ArgP n=1 Tax=Flexivirga aerilata TaxID=1656889 RepID=A0A849AHG1_9MICO|nr:LysR family transcriptional regulator ArgP [Flexivirga aerilata]NNG39829.1 LysR family transcriptional regulator ArgP [Flexivirga aerilata]